MNNTSNAISESFDMVSTPEEQFEPVLTTTEQMVISRACDLLEDMGLPVMIQHIDMISRSATGASLNEVGYRLLVHSSSIQHAGRVVDRYIIERIAH